MLNHARMIGFFAIEPFLDLIEVGQLATKVLYLHDHRPLLLVALHHLAILKSQFALR